MMSMLLGSPLTKGLALAALLLASALAFMTNLYLSTRDDLASLKSQYTQLQSDLMACTESKDKLIASAEQDDKIKVDTQKQMQAISTEKEVLLGKLRSIPHKSCTPTSENKNEIQYVDIYAPFSDEFISVFQQSSSGEAGSADTPAR